MASSSRLPRIPPAQQAQIIRANQRDTVFVSTLREQMEGVMRAWLGGRRLSRWEKEIDLLANLVYYACIFSTATQTLGEEYTNIWQYSADSRSFPSIRRRAALVFISTVPSYVISRLGTRFASSSNRIAEVLKRIPAVLDVLADVNLAVFYFSGVYYSPIKRLLRIQNITSVPENPNARPPSYSLLGVLIGIRLLIRLINALKSFEKAALTSKEKTALSTSRDEPTIDGSSVSQRMLTVPDESSAPVPAEEDEHTALDISSVPEQIRERRNCTLCLEERTSSCATECGHLFCWTCIFGWGREKAECPLCRQALDLTKLIPIYNL